MSQMTPALISRSVRAFLSALLVLGAAAGSAAAQDPSPLGDWEGTLAAGGQEIPIVFHITAGDDGELSATFDSPSQGGFGIATSAVTFADGVFSFEVPAIPGAGYEGTLSEDGSALAGHWSQSGQSLELDMSRSEG